MIAYRTDVWPGTAGDGFAMSMNMNEQGGNISFNMNGGSNATTTTTTTTSTNIDYGSGNSGSCVYAMSPGDFSEAKKAVKDADFEDTKLSTAKTISSNNCLTADQIAGICKLFDFEETKLKFSKFAYARTYDKSNYFKVNNVFDFDVSKDELNKYIQGR